MSETPDPRDPPAGSSGPAAELDPSGPRPLTAWAAILLVFGTSAAVLVLEILAGRLLAPYVGVSLETFTGIIGVILAGIAFGAWAGGVAADHVDPRRLIPPLLMLGGALAIATIPIVRVLGDSSGSGGGMRILVLTTFGFLPSATVLSAVPPAVVKLQLLDLASTGTTVGRLSAWGTAGALFGTFFTGYVLVAAAAVTTLIVSVGGLLIATGVVMSVAGGVRRSGELLGVGSVAALSLLGVVTIDSPCETQTAYYCVSIVDDGETGRILVLDDLSHSYVDLDDPERLEFWYVRRLVDAMEVQTDGPVDVVYIGGGGFTMPRYLRETRPGSEQTVIEIDGDLVDIVETDLGFDRRDDVEVVVGDGRLELRQLPDDSTDVVIGDAFGSRAVPFHLATREFLHEIDDVLRPDGIYAANVIDTAGEHFLRAYAATVAEVFDHVVVVRGPQIVRGIRGNSIIVGSPSPIDVAALQQRLVNEAFPTGPSGEQGGSGDEGGLAVDLAEADEIAGQIVSGVDDVADYVDGADVITDDFAPVDQLLSRGR